MALTPPDRRCPSPARAERAGPMRPARAVLIAAVVLAAAGPAAAAGVPGPTDAPSGGPSGATSPVAADSNRSRPAVPAPTLGSTDRSAAGRSNETGRIVAAYPDPVTDGDRGEFVVLALPHPGNWSLTDGSGRVRVPFGVAGRVALSNDPTVARELVDVPVLPVRSLSLANSGERLRLRLDGRVVDALTYEQTGEGELRTDDGWRPVTLAPREPVSLAADRVTAFALPDSPGVPNRTLSGAADRLYLAGYTLTSAAVAERLLGAHRRGADVRVLLDGSPVGGITRRQADLLDGLVAAGVPVRVVEGKRAPVRFHHAKYAVVDDRALVLTENWKPSGTGGADSRGWGVRTGEPTAAALAALFRADFGRGTVGWAAYREGRAFEEDRAGTGSYPERTPPESVSIESATLLTAPGNARSELIGAIDAADERVLVIQPTVDGPDDPLVRATLRAAERGVDVRILLGGAWYVAEENERIVDAVERRTADRSLPLRIRIADPAGRYGSVHAKGLVADDTVAVGSLNWNSVSATENREVVLLLRGAAPAEYFAAVFDGDWRASAPGGGVLGGLPSVPIGLALGATAAVAVATAVLWRTVRFER